MARGSFTAAAVQVAPVLPFDKEKTVDKVCEAMAEAADNGAKLGVLPASAAEKANLGNASWTFFGGRGIINPAGEYVAGPLYDEEGIVYGEIDLGLIPLRKAAIDTMGRDSMPQTISLNVDPTRYSPIRWGGGHGGAGGQVETTTGPGELPEHIEEAGVTGG